MKNFFLAAFVTTALFTSCSKSSSSSTTPPPPVIDAFYANLVAHPWHIKQQLLVTDIGTYVYDSTSVSTEDWSLFNFHSDNTYSDLHASGTYTYYPNTGGHIALHASNGSEYTLYGSGDSDTLTFNGGMLQVHPFTDNSQLNYFNVAMGDLKSVFGVDTSLVHTVDLIFRYKK